jgi:serine/threonine-protein kinase
MDSGETPGGQLWFTMPFVEGENVYERLQRESPFSPAEALRIALSVAGALTYAHKQGVVHRDIKPDNIMLAGDQVMVADFGVARAVSEVAEKLTATGMIVGTPTYMSPEQASGDKAIDGRSDIFALGCVLYEMLAGEPPFKGPNPQATLMRRFMGPPRPLRPMVQIPEHVEAAIVRSLAKDPAERFATASEFADALAGLGTARAANAPAAAGAPASAQGTAPAAGKRGCAAGLVAGLGLAGAAAALLHLL